jgi:ferredoxin hydrogenase large subunit
MAMGLFEHEARQFKFDVLREVALHAYENTLTQNIEDELAYKLIPTTKADFRCCVYKEREIIRQRTRLAIGKTPNIRRKEDIRPKQIVQVLEAACDGCTIKKIQITDNCRKCMAKSCISSCKFDAIKMGADRAVIDRDKCKECGACVKVCPFHAIVETTRPCKSSCAVDAISMDENGIAQIDEDRCINCAACQSACPFGAIEDTSWIVPVIQLINLETPMIAMIAPSIQGQFDLANLDQIKAGIKMLGFTDVVEVASGADAVAWFEKNELKEKMAEGITLTTSCCPAFLNLAKQHFPTIYEKNMSTLASPMIVMARMLKKKNPNTGVVFIGPCVAKKQEAMSDGMFPDVDYVLTYEEVAAMLVAKRIYLNDLECDTNVESSVFGRNFAFGSGVSKALNQAAIEDGGFTFKSEYADGCQECKKQLMILRAGRFSADVLEGMSCKGGCGNGPAIIDNSNKVKVRFDSENSSHKGKKIKDTVVKYGFDEVDMHRHPTKEIKSW